MAIDFRWFYLEIPLGIVLIVSTGFLSALIYQQKARNRSSEKMKLLQTQYKDISQQFKAGQEELARKKEIAEGIPVIVRNLTETLPESAIPPIVIRFSKEFFHALRVGYFVPQEETGEFILLDGAGFPPDLMGRIRIPSDDDILGTAIRKKTSYPGKISIPGEQDRGERLRTMGG